MKFAYKADGTVTGLNRNGQEDELTGYCSEQDLTLGMTAEYYTVTNGALKAKPTSLISKLKASHMKSSAVRKVLSLIETECIAFDKKDFLYNGNWFISDRDNIQFVQNECLASDPNEPIRTFLGTINEGKWLGRNKFIQFTCGEFIEFASAYFERGSNNFTIKAEHIMAVKIMEQDTSKTAQDVLNYNYSTGWH